MNSENKYQLAAGALGRGARGGASEPLARHGQESLVCASRDPVLGEPAFRSQQVGDKWCPQRHIQLPVASVQCEWQPGDGGLDEVPLHQGLGMAWHGSWAWPQSNLQFSPVEPEARALGWERCCPGH